MRYKRVAVLLGGLSAEREISLRSGKAVAAALRRLGRDVVEIDAGRELDVQLRNAAPNAVYIALHGKPGEDGTIQGLLESIGLPYTGSGVLASALAMDKIRSRDLFAANGLPIARGFALNSDSAVKLPPDMTLPVVVKPSCEGSSVGVNIVRDKSALDAAVEEARSLCSGVLIESFVEGPEVTVAVLDGKSLGALEIEPNREFYNYSAKYDKGGSKHHIPPRIDKRLIEKIEELAEKAYAAMGCSSAARVDFIASTKGSPVILELNTIPGMTEVSLLPEIAASRGMSFDQLVERIVEGAALYGHDARKARSADDTSTQTNTKR